ncbi:hypothetical protein BBJ28_00025872 [Nothophytophthora sp. Chile5]|nr:hypothetical protein BBJ28_00025872 [Nothophytophthora sp. Chile5]
MSTAQVTPPAPYCSYIQPNADAEFPAEKGRYHLYVAYMCPFACRALAARNLKGLEDAIGLSVAHSVSQRTRPDDENDTHRGWTFVDPKTTPTVTASNGKEYSTEGCTPDTVNHVKFVRDLYELVDKTPRKFSVPVLWDKKKQTIVSEQSTDIMRTLDSGFRDLVPSNVRLYPEELRDEIDAVNNGILEEISQSFVQLLFAKTPEAMQEELKSSRQAVAKLDALLAKSRYLVGNGVTEADIRMLHTLIRMDLNFHKADKQNLMQYPNVVGYLRDLYQIPGMKRSVNWDHLKIGLGNFLPVAPEGPFVDYDAPHDRAQLA